MEKSKVDPTAAATIARGGKAIYGAPLGILMLEARFPRIPGDMGNGTTWPFPVLYRVVRGATPEKVVLQGRRGLLPDFVAAAQELVRWAPRRITTNCGFLSLFQSELAAAVGVPVATSSLMQVPWVQAMLPPGKRVGIVTVSGVDAVAGPSRRRRACRSIRRWSAPRTGREFFRVLIRAEKDDMDVALAREQTSSTPAKSWWRAIRKSAPSCSSAPTCRPMPPRCRPKSACRCTTSIR